MADDPSDPETPSRASLETQRFVDRRREARKAVIADRLRARAERGDDEADEPNRRGFLLGFVVVAVLCIIGWYLIDQMRCNPLFSNVSFAQAQSCR